MKKVVKNVKKNSTKIVAWVLLLTMLATTVISALY